MRSLFTMEVGSAIKRRFNSRLSEWHIAVVMTGCGLMVAFEKTFELPAYEMVLRIASQSTWAAVMFAVGASRLAVLVVNGAMPHLTMHLRYILASMSALVWTGLFVGLAAFDTPLLLGVFVGAAIIVDIISAYRAARYARQCDDDSGVGDGIFR